VHFHLCWEQKVEEIENMQYSKIAFVTLLTGSIGFSVAAKDLPTTEQFQSMLTSCAIGANIEVSADIVGSISTIYDGDKTQGKASIKSESKFLELMPEKDRLKAYELYTACISKLLGVRQDEEEQLKTEVIRYFPKIPSKKKSGHCWIESVVAAERPGAWRCTVGNRIYDPCFDTPTDFAIGGANRIVCNSYPYNESGAFILSLTEPLPQIDPNEDVRTKEPQAWLVELLDGRFCHFSSGATSVFYGERVNYFCEEDAQDRTTVLLGYPTRGKLWKAYSSITDEGGKVLGNEEVGIKRAWW
jgi:hypothetical protein